MSWYVVKHTDIFSFLTLPYLFSRKNKQYANGLTLQCRIILTAHIYYLKVRPYFCLTSDSQEDYILTEFVSHKQLKP